MCAPEDMVERIDPAVFERFETGGIVIFVERNLLSEEPVRFTVRSAGDFTLAPIPFEDN